MPASASPGDGMTARGHSRQPGGEPIDAGKSTSAAEKAAAIDAAQEHPPTWKIVVKRALPVVVAGAAIYLVLPALIKVLGEWPRLSTLNPIWFTVALAAEIIAFTCNFALQRGSACCSHYGSRSSPATRPSTMPWSSCWSG
jgi:hypothetical protein